MHKNAFHSPGHFLKCWNGVFGSQGLNIRSDIRMKLQAPVIAIRIKYFATVFCIKSEIIKIQK